MADFDVNEAKRLLQEGKSLRELGRKYNCHPESIKYKLRRELGYIHDFKGRFRLPTFDVDAAIEMKCEGYSDDEIAKKFRVAKRTIHYHIAKRRKAHRSVKRRASRKSSNEADNP